jgi:hypothetical protein
MPATIVPLVPRFSAVDLAALYKAHPKGTRVCVESGDVFAYDGGVISKARGGFVRWDDHGRPLKKGRTVEEVMA